VLASATQEGGTIPDMKIPVPEEPEHIYKEAHAPEVFRVDCVECHPILKHVINHVGKESSLLVMRLILDGRFLGSFSVQAKGKDRFTEDHARLIGLLNDPFAIALSNILRYREVLKLKDQLDDDYHYLQDEMRHIVGDEIIGANFGLKGVMELVNIVAPINSSVTLLGETGVGKELIANAIHSLSPRSDGPFIKVNCGAIPETLIDSELFGHEKGAFTGAIARKRGRFERADHGTVFLDEIGELPHKAQVRLLRVLQEKEFERVGGTDYVKVDIRVIAATHRNLEARVEDGRFREDLYFRLRVFPIEIPPLRDRKSDIPALVQHFMHTKNMELGLKGFPTLAQGAIERLMKYDFPGNVRELEHMVERELILNRGKPLQFHDFLISPGMHDLRPAKNTQGQKFDLDEVVSDHIRHVLDKTGGKVQGEKGAAALMGIKPNTLRYRMKKLGIPFSRGYGQPPKEKQ
ncbi:MAG: sigma 54-interacting transcriptional regulator, partial [Deltaproteobacteria bacterium]|nr:sigma 54-interacting transcriptional regulator [Deltaproteobacteria bacterium]